MSEILPASDLKIENRFCTDCRSYLNGNTAQLCQNKNLPSGQSEPLFYAILKCGPNRAWFERNSIK